MIKKVSINYPFLQLEREFKKWLNIIEEENWFWKSTILNTIQSVFTFRYPGMRSLPDGTASIETDKDKFILSKKNWIGTTHEQNNLYNYIVPWKFFELKSTTDQRKVLIDLLDLDYDTFMKTECDKSVGQFKYLVWSEDLDKNLNAKMKEFETNETLILQDINRLKSELINFDTKTFEDIERYNQDKEKVLEAIKEYNRLIIWRQNNYNQIKSEISMCNTHISSKINEIRRIESIINDYNIKLENLRNTYSDAEKNAKCESCWSKLDLNWKQELLDKIIKDANLIKLLKDNNEISSSELNIQLENYNKELVRLEDELKSIDTDFTIISYDDLLWAALKLDLELVQPTKERFDEYEEYKSMLSKKQRTEEELKYKEDSLKAINTLELQSSIDRLKEIKSMFTNKLEEATKSLPLDIQLFETLKNGNVKETFTIRYKDTDYYDLSTWNKWIANIMLAKLFVDKLWLDLILIDEWGLISKSNLDYIKELAKTHQVIVAKATNWWVKDIK